VRPDPVVLADPQAHLLDVRPNPLADVGHLVHKRNAGRQQAVRRVLDHLRRTAVDHKNRVALPHKRPVETLQLLGGPPDTGPDHHPVRLQKILHRRPLPQKLRVRHHGHLLPVLQASLLENRLDLLPGADRHGAFVDQDAPPGAAGGSGRKQVRHVGGRLPDVAQVRRPLLPRRRRKGKNDHLRPFGPLGQIGRKPEPILRPDPLEVALQVRLVNRQLPGPEPGDLLLVDVHAANLVAHLRKTGPGDKPDIPRANY